MLGSQHSLPGCAHQQLHVYCYSAWLHGTRLTAQAPRASPQTATIVCCLHAPPCLQLWGSVGHCFGEYLTTTAALATCVRYVLAASQDPRLHSTRGVFLLVQMLVHLMFTTLRILAPGTWGAAVHSPSHGLELLLNLLTRCRRISRARSLSSGFT